MYWQDASRLERVSAKVKGEWVDGMSLELVSSVVQWILEILKQKNNEMVIKVFWIGTVYIWIDFRVIDIIQGDKG